MKDKAIVFDGSRCVGCQACAAACKRRGQLPLSPEEGNEAPADAYQRAADVDGLTPLVVMLSEREAAGTGVVWEAARKGCVRCFEAPCANVCPTGALTIDEALGLMGPDTDRCVSCGLCSMVCPAALPRHAAGRAAVCLCDGCADRVADGAVPVCVSACPTGAMAYGDRADMVALAHDRAAVLRDRGYDRAAVLGEAEQGGHFVVQVLKYGIQGQVNEPFTTAEDLSWAAAAKMAGPVSIGVLGALAAGAAVGLAVEANKARRERSEAVRVPVKAYEGMGNADVVPIDSAEEPDETAVAATEEAVDGESALEAALRKREAARARAVATPAAAAAAAAAARGQGPVLIPVAFDEAEEEDGFADEAVDVEACESDVVVDEKEDTGELYDVEEFNRLLKADILAHHAVKVAAKQEEDAAADEEPEDRGPDEESAEDEEELTEESSQETPS